MIRILPLLLCVFFIHVCFGQQDKLFWFAVPRVTAGHGNAPVTLNLSAAGKPANVRVEIPAAGITLYQATLQANMSAAINLTQYLTLLQTTPDSIIGNGLLITADNRISAYYEVNNIYNSEIFVLKGKNALGKDFIIPGATNSMNGGLTPAALNTFDIVATEDSTVVTITPKKAIKGHPAGIPFTIVLNRGQTFSAAGVGGSPSNHLAGSTVHANKPVAITLNDDSIFMPGITYGCLDLAGDQLIPVNVAGSTYITMPSFLAIPNSTQTVPTDWVYITATADNTIVYVDQLQKATLQAGETFTLPSYNTVFYIESSKPVLVYQVSGWLCEVGSAVLPPITCTGSAEVSFVRSSVLPDSLYMLLLVQSGYENGFTFNGNNAVIPASAFQPVPASNGKWKYARISVPATVLPYGNVANIRNSGSTFHLGLLSGVGTYTSRYGYFSGFAAFDEVELKTNAPVCDSGVVTLTCDLPASLQNYAVTWLNPSNQLVAHQASITLSPFTAAQEGTYRCLVNKSNCTSDTFRIVANILHVQLDSIVGTTIVCRGDSIQLAPSNTVAGYTYQWLAPNGITASGTSLQIPAATKQNEGDYQLTASNGNCTASVWTHVRVDTAIQCHAFTADTVCIGGQIRLTATSDKPKAIYQWRGPGAFTSSMQNPVISGATTAMSGRYYVSVSYGGCYVAMDSVMVTVLDYSDVVITHPGAVCAGNAINLLAQSNVPYAFQWSGPLGLIGSGGNAIIASATSADSGMYSLQITRSGCADTIIQTQIAVQPIPKMTAIPPVLLCNGSTTAIHLTSTISSSFSWSVAAASPGILGASAGQGNDILQTLTNNSNLPGSVKYAVTPFSTAGCIGKTDTVLINVTGEKARLINALRYNLCSGAVASVSLTANIQASFSWKPLGNSQRMGATAGSGSMINDTLIAGNHVTADTVQYLVTPVSVEGCIGISDTVTVLVHPLPLYNGRHSDSVCTGTITNIVLSASVPSTFTWLPHSSPSAASGATAGSGLVIHDQLINTDSAVAHTVTYDVSLVSAAGCQGTNEIVNVSVLPSPKLTSQNFFSLCSGTVMNLQLSASVPSAFSWTTIAVSSISGNKPGNGNFITDTLVNNSATTGLQATYSVTPLSMQGCVGTVDTIRVSVQPSPVIIVNGNTTICSSDTTNVRLSATVSSTLTWAPLLPNLHITGAASGSGSAIRDVLINDDSSASATIDYTITGVSVAGCRTRADTIHITVRPSPRMRQLAPVSICSGMPVSIPLSASVNATFNWAPASNVSTIAGATAGSGVVITDVLRNLSNTAAGEVHYIVMPVSVNGCAGAADSIVVMVHPLPMMIHTAIAERCSGSALALPLQATVPAVFSWVPAVTGTTVTSARAGTGTLINDTLVNPGNSQPASATYLVTAVSPVGCIGTVDTVQCIIHPIPALVLPPAIDLCSGSSLHINLNASTPSVFQWMPATVIGSIQGAANGSGSIITDTLVNADSIITARVIYTVVPVSLKGCTGHSGSFSVDVTPSIRMFIDNHVPICSGDTIAINLRANVAGNFSWTIGAAQSVTGAVPGTGNTIVAGLTNPGLTDGVVEYLVSFSAAVSGTCSTSIRLLPVIVHALPNVMIDPFPAICATADTIFFTNGKVVPWQNGSGQYFLDSILVPYVKPDSTMTGTHIVKYRFVSVYGCFGEASTPLVIRDPPVVDAGPDKSIYTGDAVVLNGSVSIAGSYTWSPPDRMNNRNILTPEVRPLFTTMYYLDVTDDAKCTVRDSVLVVVNRRAVRVPNAFSPNGDGRNDSWVIDDLKYYPDCLVQVFNRWGQKIFESKGYQEPWKGADGKGNMLPVGTYYYLINVGAIDEKPLTGWVQLLR